MSKKIENGLFQKNMEIFSKRYPEATEKFEKREYELEQNITVKEECAYTGEPILTIKKNEKKKYLAGKYAPQRPLLDWIEKQDRVYNEMVLMIIGMGNWLQLEAFLDKIDKKMTIILYEPSIEIFESVMETYEVGEVLEKYNVGLVVEKLNTEYLESFFSVCINRENISLTKVYISGNYLTLFPKLVTEKVGQLKKYFERMIINWNTKIRYTGVVGENILNNIAFFYHGYTISQFKDALPKEVPVIVVSAGPSLNKNIDELKRAVGRCCIVATDTAVKPLLNHGIYPHFVAIVDGKKPALLFEHPELKKCALLTAANVAKNVMNLHTGKKVFYKSGSFLEDDIVERINEEREENALEILPLPTGGSVANDAFSFGVHLGAKNIILMGQDLALTGNKTHADGTFKEKMDTIDATSKSYFEVESIDGGKVLTRPDFDHYRKWFEDRIEEYRKKKHDICVIDATEGGAKIHGTKIMTLKEAIERFCISDFDMDKVIAEMPEMLSEHEKEVFLNHLGNTVIRLEEVRKKAKAGVNHYNKMIQVAKKKTLNTTRYMELYKKVKNVNEFMDTDEMAGFVLSNLEEMQNAILSTINLEEENEHDERVILAKKGKIALETMLPMVDKLIDIANATIMEYKGDDSILYDRYQQGMENWPV